MHADIALRMMGDLFWTGFLVCIPLLASTMLVGAVIGLLQAVTQVQEMALSFVPKLLVAGVALIMAGPWMLRMLTRFTVQLWTGIPSLF